MKALIEQVQNWSEAKGLHEANPKGQALKVIEEFTEMITEIGNGDVDAICDGVGDTYVTLIILGQQMDIDFCARKVIAKSTLGAVSFSEGYARDSVTGLAAFDAINTLATGVSKSNMSFVLLAFTQILVLLERVLIIYDVTDAYCLEMAYNEIKDRRGKMVNGIFVKESDL